MKAALQRDHPMTNEGSPHPDDDGRNRERRAFCIARMKRDQRPDAPRSGQTTAALVKDGRARALALSTVGLVVAWILETAVGLGSQKNKKKSLGRHVRISPRAAALDRKAAKGGARKALALCISAREDVGEPARRQVWGGGRRRNRVPEMTIAHRCGEWRDVFQFTSGRSVQGRRGAGAWLLAPLGRGPLDSTLDYESG